MIKKCWITNQAKQVVTNYFNFELLRRIKNGSIKTS